MMFWGTTVDAGSASGHGTRRSSALVGYLVAAALVTAVTALLLLIQSYIPLGRYPVYYFLTIMLVAYHFGVGPAVLAFAIGLVAFDYSFIPPLGTPLPHAETPQGWAGIISYVVGTTVVGTATVLIRRSKQRAERIAERLRESEAHLLVQRQLLEAVVNNIPAQINLMRGSDFRIELINPAYQAIAPGKEMVGKTLDEVWPELDRNFTDLCRKVLETGVPYEMVDDQVDISRYPGGPTERRYFTWSLIPVDLPGENGRGILNMSVETTERKRAEEAVVSQAELLLGIIENIPVYLVIWDGQLQQFQFNEAFRRDMGWTEADAAEGDFMEKAYPDPEYRSQVQEYMQSLQPGFRDLKTTTKDGRHLDVSWANVQLSGDRSIGIGVNITDRKQAEEALKEEQEHKLDFYRRTIGAATNGKLQITEPSEIDRIAGPADATWGIHGRDDIGIVRHGVQEIARSAGITGSRLMKLTVAAGEAVTNAVKHAGAGEASIHRTEDSIMVVVSDRGAGIPVLALPDVALRPRFSTAGTLGMGYKMMIKFADRIYLATGVEGTTVGIEMRLHPEASAPGTGSAESAPGEVQ